MHRLTVGAGAKAVAAGVLYSLLMRGALALFVFTSLLQAQWLQSDERQFGLHNSKQNILHDVKEYERQAADGRPLFRSWCEAVKNPVEVR